MPAPVCEDREMDRDQVTHWVAAYEAAWRAAGTGALAGIFATDAVYRQGPYDEPVSGLPAIARMWEAERDGPAEVFTMTSAIVAADGDTAVVRAEVRYGDPVTQEWRDLWIIRLGPDGRCTSFEEWPIAPPRH
jgi:ketosteroid isomerase-like protein